MRLFLRKETCSSTLKCLANCRTIIISNLPSILSFTSTSQLTNLATELFFVPNFLNDLTVILSAQLTPQGKNPTLNRTYLTKSAARKPAPATTNVCGDPFDLGASANLAGFSENSSRNSGRLSLFRGFWKEVVSLIAFAVHHMSTPRFSLIMILSFPFLPLFKPSMHSPEMYRSESSTELRSVPNRVTF